MNESLQKANESQQPATRAARTGTPARAVAQIWLLVGLIGGVFLALVGALDSYDYSLLFRIGFWIPLCLLAAALGGCIEWLVDRWTHKRVSQRLSWLIIGGLFVSVMTPVVFALNARSDDPLDDLLMYLQNCTIICAAFIALRLILQRLMYPPIAHAEATSESTVTPAFMQRLSPQLRQSALFAIKAEGHYIQVWTDQGKELVLFRFKDAVREIDEAQGMQVHRSWWVARNAIAGSRRERGKLVLRLKNDIDVPVSRSNVQALKTTGWL